jgi:hypothetical protein
MEYRLPLNKNNNKKQVLNLPTVAMVYAPIVIVMTIFMVASFGLNHNVLAQGQNNSGASNMASTNATVPSTISLPLSKGFVDGKVSYFVATDASEKQIVSSISNTTNYTVNYAPSLANTSESSRQQGYVFLNGLKGTGPMGSQLSVATALPGDSDYSPLFQINYVKWNPDAMKNIRILKSADEIMAAQKSGELTISKSNIVINSPFISEKSLP